MANRRAKRVTFRAVATAAAVGVVLGLGAHSLLPTAGSAVPDVDAHDTAAEVAGAVLERDSANGGGAGSVMRVESEGCGERRQASATVLSTPDGELVLTNAHVVRGAGTVTLHSTDGGTVVAQVVGLVSGRDAAVLRPFDRTSLVDAAPTARGATVGDGVVVVGFPQGEFLAGSGTVVDRDLRSGYGGSVEMLLVDTPAEGGLSGGAVLDEHGRAVGLVAARDPDTGRVVAYPIDEVVDEPLVAPAGC